MMGKSNEALAVVNIGYHELLLPLSKASQLVALLGNGVWVDGKYEDGGMRYVVIQDQEQRIGMQIVRPNQIVAPPGEHLVGKVALWQVRKALPGPTKR
jgi:hypothetical protein